MVQIRFTIRQLLVAVAVAALLLLAFRFALRSHELGVAATICGIGAVLLLTANLFVYALVRIVGLFWATGPTHPHAQDDGEAVG